MSVSSKKLKVAIITCYFDPDYVRSRVLRAALQLDPTIETIVVKNSHKGIARYPEIFWKIFRTRITEKPDIYLLTFRGQEVLPMLLLLAWSKPVVFDEFLLPLAMLKQEKYKMTPTIALQKILVTFSAVPYRWWLRACSYIITDTIPDADLSAELSHIPRTKYQVLPVGAEEELFEPLHKVPIKKEVFEVFTYGNMKPLYGLTYILEAAKLLQGLPVHITIVGGTQLAEDAIAAARAAGASVDYKTWIPFHELPQAMHTADMCLAGQFGGTPQAMRVVSGKAYQMLACAVPTLIGISDATSDFIDKDNCLLVPQANAVALADKITWALQHQSQLDRIGKAGRALYESKYSTKAIADQLNPKLHSLVSG